jgi:Kef-type K+ transport system membrane component KefB
MEAHTALLALMLMWAVAKLAAEVMQRVGQTAVLGELLAGVLLGPAGLGWVTDSQTLRVFAELGVVILLFEVGLESDIRDFVRAGPQSIAIAVTGVAIPFLAGYLLMSWLGHAGLVAVLVGATLTATSVGITARVLADLGRLNDATARIIIGAAVVDDVIGLVILAVVGRIAQVGTFSIVQAVSVLALAVAFLAIVLAAGIRLARPLTRWVGRMQTRGALLVFALVLALGMGQLADRIGLAVIVGSFAAGLILAQTERQREIHRDVMPVADVFVPLFFVLVGVHVQLSALNPFNPQGEFTLAIVLAVLAILSKVASGLVVYQPGIRRLSVGVGMVPRGEVGLIFAGVGLSLQVFDEPLYSALVAVVMLTTFIAPPWLKLLFRAPRSALTQAD